MSFLGLKLTKEIFIKRRDFFINAALGSAAISSQLLTSCATGPILYGDKNYNINRGYQFIPKLKLSKDRIIKETVGLRPFRASGPRIEKQLLGNKTIVHNYGHGGSGWSLSWGTGHLARKLVMEQPDKKIALIGAGTVGIATATLLQESGYEVTIYTKDVPPNITSNLATGTWSPASRVCYKTKSTPEFEKKWEEATRFSFRRLQMLLGMEDIVSWCDDYVVHKSIRSTTNGNGGGEIFHLDGLAPDWVLMDKKNHPFQAEYVRKRSNMIFNIPSYLNFHLNNFLLRGGKLKIYDIKTLEDIDALPEKVIVNCMGLGAKSVFNDEELMPISGQLACLIPQNEVNYKLATKGAYFITRKDGIYLGGNGIDGSWDTNPKRELTEKWIDVLMDLMKEMKG